MTNSKPRNYSRICPTESCKRTIWYVNKYKRNRAEKMGYVCAQCIADNYNPWRGRKHSEESKAKMKEAALARRDTKTEEFREKMRGVYKQHHRNKKQLSNYEYQVLKYGVEEANRLREIDKERKSKRNSGAGNPMYGKPAPRGSGTGWQGYYNGKFFRSLRELRFMLENPTAVTAENRYWRATFFFLEKQRTTIPDFLLEEQKLVVECKPIRLHNTPLVLAKAEAMRILCKSRGYSYQLVDPGILSKSKITELIELGEVVLTPSTRARYDKFEAAGFQK